ncbi:MAG: TetR/AcrR family transcriptional regulator [Ilumatobacteraceae bacterium]
MGASAKRAVDGRRQRTERGRAAVIDAMFDLIVEGHLPPAVDQVARRAGVSIATIFRYFGTLDDLQQETVARFVERFDHLLEIDRPGEGSATSLVRRFVDSRVTLFSTVGLVMHLAWVRSLDQPRIAAAVRENRRRLRDATEEHFASVLGPRSARRNGLVDAIDGMCSIEAWVSLTRIHDRSPDEIRRAWTAGVSRLVGP